MVVCPAPATGRSGLPDNKEIRGRCRKILGSTRPDDGVVLDSNASPTFKIDARLDGDHRPRVYRSVARARKSWFLMDFQPDPMARGVPHSGSESGVSEAGTGGLVHLWAGPPGRQHRKGGPLGTEYGPMNLSLPRGRVGADHHCASQV